MEQPVRRRTNLWGNRFSCKQKALFALCVNAFTAFTLLFFPPMEVYLGNVMEFAFPPSVLWWMLLLEAAAMTVLVSAVEMLLPERLFAVVNLAGLSLGLCAYIQAAFLNSHMGTLTGTTDVYETGLIVGNLLLWGAVWVAVYLFFGWMAHVQKRRTAVSSLVFLSLALLAMQTTALVVQWMQTDTAAMQKGTYLTGTDEFVLSSEQNVVEFVVDSCDVRYFEQTMERYPDMTDGLRGFTYYPNATSTHSRTYPSVTYMLTGRMCYFDRPMTQYVDEAWQNGTFVPDLKAAGCDVRVFTESPYISDAALELVDNSGTVEGDWLSYISPRGLLTQMLKISLYRESPYCIKWRFAYDGGKVNRAVMRYPDPVIEENDAYFYHRLTSDRRLTVSDDYSRAYRFYHFSGAHPGERLSAQATASDTADRLAAIRGNIYIIEEYLAQLKALGLYESTTVIITADHGSSGSTDHSSADNLEIAYPYRPLMLVKPAGVGDEAAFATSQAPVCHSDLFATVLTGVGSDAAAYGEAIWNIAPDTQRERYYYFTAMYSDANGEVALREYRVDGDAGDPANWTLTGRYWDILYSERAVSRHRLSDLRDDVAQAVATQE